MPVLRFISGSIPWFLYAFAVPVLFSVPSDAEPSAPNIVLIIVDDLGWRDLSVQGSAYYETPHIDRLARNGVRFLQGYASCQVCSPSRASIMTGRTPARMNTTDWFGAAMGNDWDRNTRLLPARYTSRLDPDRITLAEALKEAGYATFFAGKWHLGDSEEDWPEYHGFDVNKGGHDKGSPPGGYFAPWKNPRLANGPDGELLPLRLARETAAFIDAHAHESFFATLCFYSVHGPAQTTQALWKKYREKSENQPTPTSRFALERRRPIRTVQDNPIYGGMVESMDTAVGMVMEALERNNLAENTIILFTSDNGGVASGDHWATANLPLRGGKGYQWEGGIRVPFILSWPREITPAINLDSPVMGTDIYPTLLDLSGLPQRPEEHLDGVSIVPAVRGEQLPERPLFWHYPHYSNQGGDPSSIVRLGDWKLVHYHESQVDELYRLGEDPMESQDVARKFPGQARRLRVILDAWLAEVDARFPTPNPNFDKRKFAEQQKQMVETELPHREKEAGRILDPDWQPDPEWWGSEPGIHE